MQIQEFEQRTGIFLTNDLYKIIEDYYMDFDGDKDDFCTAYKENRNGLAEHIREQLTKEVLSEKAAVEQKEKDLYKQITDLQETVKNLQEKLDRELEWKPYTEKENVEQKDYEKLRDNHFTEKLSDEEAAEYINQYYGFEKDRIQVIHEVPVYEINRHNALRQVGVEERDPLYASSDWNYIRFDCAGVSYELDDGTLRMFVD